MLSKLAVRRLTKLADYMDALPPEARNHFHMGWFVSSERDELFEASDIRSVKDLMTCGTTACAAGWAATIPSFRKAGYSVDDLEEFFDLDWSQCDALFESGLKEKIKTPKQWARHCRAYIKRQGIEK